MEAKVAVGRNKDETNFSISVEGKTNDSRKLRVSRENLCRGCFMPKETLSNTASKRFGVRESKIVTRKLDYAPDTTHLFEINNIPKFYGGEKLDS